MVFKGILIVRGLVGGGCTFADCWGCGWVGKGGGEARGGEASFLFSFLVYVVVLAGDFGLGLW